jgi:hypothetical protein
MDVEEAKEWLGGYRSMSDTFHLMENQELLTVQADLAMMQQAYIVLKADSENLI